MTYEDISVEDYKARFKDANTPHLLLDVRTTEEYAEVRIPGAVNIPLDELEGRIDEITQAANGEPVVVVCRSGGRSAMGAEVLRMAGVNQLQIYNLDTGTLGWTKLKFPTESD